MVRTHTFFDSGVLLTACSLIESSGAGHASCALGSRSYLGAMRIRCAGDFSSRHSVRISRVAQLAHLCSLTFTHDKRRSRSPLQLTRNGFLA